MNLSELIDNLGNSFRGLWTSVIFFDSNGGITKKKEWSVTYLFNSDMCETPGFDIPEQALEYAIQIKKRETIEIEGTE